jgi:hypothetical protein
MSKKIQFALIITSILYFASLWYIQQAHSHSWYDKDCCNKKDCAPVIEMVRDSSNKGWIMTSKHGTALVLDRSNQIRMLSSQDSNVHICIGFYDQHPLSENPKTKEKFGYARCVYWPVS